MRHCRRKCVERLTPAIFELLVPSKLRESQQIERSNRTRRRLGAIVVVFHSQHDTGVLAACAKVSVALLIKKQSVLRFLQFNRELQPLDVERRLVKIEKPLDHKCVIVGETFDVAATTAIISIEQLA